jgi:hypothetical protein
MTDLREAFEDLVALTLAASAEKDATIARLTCENEHLKSLFGDFMDRLASKIPPPRIHITQRVEGPTKSVFCRKCARPFEVPQRSDKTVCQPCRGEQARSARSVQRLRAGRVASED